MNKQIVTDVEDGHSFNPDWRSHPGETLNDMLQERSLTAGDVAIATGFALEYVQEVMLGRSPITAMFAVRLNETFDTSAEFWLIRQMHFDLHEAREIRYKECSGDVFRDIIEVSENTSI